MTTYAVVGSGWRSEFFLRFSRLLGDNLNLVGVVARNDSKRAEISSTYDVPTYQSVSDLLKVTSPDFVVVAVSWEQNPLVVTEIVAAGIPVLCETPPAPDVEGLRKLWNSVGASNLVQVAEQYHLYPDHAARISAVKAGCVGVPTSVEISSTHGYHAVSIMRSFLNAGFGQANVKTSSFVAPLSNPLTREGWNSDLTPSPRSTVISTIDYGNEKSGIYNFVENQWHNQLRQRRLVVRGSLGEISDDSLLKLVDGPVIVKSQFNRYQLGRDLNLDGNDLEHISLNGEVIYKNPFIGLRLMDEEIAIGSLLLKMVDWVRGDGLPPYPLREACQDHLISKAIDESLALDAPVTTQFEPWGI